MADGKIIIEQNENWDDGESGRKTVKISNRRGVPNGEYTLVLGIGGEVAMEGKMAVGNRVDESDSEVSGRLVDSRTGRPIDGGLVIVLKPRVNLRSFLQSRREEDVQSTTESGRDRKFTIPEQLPNGQAYGLLVAARGFRPLTVAGALRIGPGAPEEASVGDLELDPA